MVEKRIFAICCKIRNILFFHGYGKIGRCSYIIKPMRIIGKKNIYIGDDCSVLHHARIETVSRWENMDFHGKIRIGNHTTIEQNCHIIAADELKIGDNCVLSSDVYVADCGHSCDEMEGSVMQKPLFVKKTSIGDGCFIGTGAKIMPGVNIGNYVVVGANAVVTKDIDDYTMVAGVPATPIKKYVKEEKAWKRV